MRGAALLLAAAALPACVSAVRENEPFATRSYHATPGEVGDALLAEPTRYVPPTSWASTTRGEFWDRASYIEAETRLHAALCPSWLEELWTVRDAGDGVVDLACHKVWGVDEDRAYLILSHLDAKFGPDLAPKK